MVNYVATALMAVAIAIGGQTATTEDGRKVQLNQDKTWEYIDTVQVDEAVDDCLYTSESVDKMTGKKSYSSTRKLVVSADGGESGFGFFLLRAQDGELIISMDVVGGGCIDDKAKMLWLFRDGTRIETRAHNKFNCSGDVVIYAGNPVWRNMDLYNKLKTVEVETLRVYTRKSYVQEDFTPEQSKELKESIVCIEEYNG